MGNRPLYIPIMLEALIIGNKSGELAALSPDYKATEHLPLGRYVTTLFSTHKEEPGVHLHWTLPDSLSHGVYSEEEEQIVFPSLPNRWILQRMHATNDGSINRNAWIIESDFITNKLKDGQYSKLRTSIPTFKLKDGRWVGAGLNGEIYGYLGNAREYGTRQTEPGYYFQKLTTIGAGDISFAAFYPLSSSVFGFYDNMKNAPQGSYTYTLVGYYEKSEEDPLHNATEETLKTLNWSYDACGELPSKTVCHSTLKCVKWIDSNANYESGVPAGPINAYLGNTSAEALSAVLQDAMPKEKGLERMLNALQNNFLKELDDSENPDSVIELEEKLHERQFSSEEQGIVWRLRNLEDATDIQTLDPQTYENIEKLNQLQDEYDLLVDKTKSQKDELYSAWFRYTILQADPWKFQKTDQLLHPLLERDLKVMRMPKLDNAKFRDRINILLHKIPEARPKLNTMQEGIKQKVSQLNACLVEKKLEITRHNKNRFYFANSPALVLSGSGVGRAYKQGFQTDSEDGNLHCRTSLLTDNKVSINGKHIPVTGREVATLCTTLKGQLPDFAQDLLEESLLLSEDCARSIGIKAYFNSKTEYTKKQLDDLILSIQENQRSVTEFSGCTPSDLAISSWKQPWSPLLMEWEIKLTPVRTNVESDDSFEKFALEKIDFELNAGETVGKSGLTIQGLTLLTPHAATNMSAMLSKLIENYGDSGKYDTLKEIAERVKEMQLLSQRMDGFNEALIMRRLDPVLPIFETDAELAVALTKALDQTLTTPDPRDVETSRFIPIRAGFMEVHELWLVDSFGQRKVVHVNDRLHVSESLRCNEKKSKALFPPRFIQPTTMRFKWLSLPDKNEVALESVDASSGPVFGFIVPNFLDGNIQLYDKAGSLLGLVQKSEGGAKWMKPFPSNVDVDQIKNEHLKHFALGLLGDSNKALSDFLRYLDNTFSQTAPTGNEEFMQMCFGKPLVLARASVQVFGKGEPPSVQWFREVRRYNNSDKAKFSVRFGDSLKIFDGHFGFFLGDSAKDIYKQFYATNDVQSSSKYINSKDSFKTSLSDKPKNLTFLLDPAGCITISTGFLPVKKITLDAIYYKTVMENSEMLLRLAPVLLSIDHLELPLPGGLEDTWSFSYVAENQTVKNVKNIYPPALLPSALRQEIIEGVLNTAYKKEKNRGQI